MVVDILSYSDDSGLAQEMAGAGQELAKTLNGINAALEFDEVRAGVRYSGNMILAKQVGRALGSNADSAGAAIAEVARSKKSRIILIGATKFGRIVAAKVAVALKIGSLGGAKRLEFEGDELVAVREVYAGKFTARVASKLPCVALVQPGSYPPAQGPAASVEALDVTVPEPMVSLIQTLKNPTTDVDLRSASMIVAVGRGLSKKEDLPIIETLAKTMGAAVGCSRPISSDLGWMDEKSHIGLSGIYVHPKLYVAIGISGQLQHVAGIKDSKTIVAINKDKHAPIFQVADYGIVGDLYQVVPELTKLLS